MNIQTMIKPAVAKLKPYESARKNAQEGVLLDANENPYGEYSGYPDPYCKKVRETLSDYLNVEVENIFVGNGSDEIIDLLIRVFCSPEDEIMIFSPSYGMYEVCAQFNDVEVNKVNLNTEFQIDMEATLQAIKKKTKLIFVCTPNNPTGNCINEEDIVKLCSRGEEIIIVDEAYIEFANLESIVRLVDVYPNLVVVRTLSKGWGAAGLRLGYCVCSKEIQEILMKVKAPYNVSALNQTEALKILSNRRSMEYSCKLICLERERLVFNLKQLGLMVFPSDANFVLFTLPKASKIKLKLQDNGVVVRDRTTDVKNALRVSIGKKEDNDKFLGLLKDELLKVAFIDRDGVVLFEPKDDFQVDSLEKYRLLPGVVEGLGILRDCGYKLVMVSNQNGIGSPSFPEKSFLIPQNQMIEDLATEGIRFDEIFICPHFASANCKCRKPRTGLVREYLDENPINYLKSFMVGDRETDMQFAENIGVRGIKAVNNGDSLLQFAKQIQNEKS